MLRSVRPPRFDAILALALAAAAQAEAWSGLLAGPKSATLPASLAYTLPLAWRGARRFQSRCSWSRQL